MSYFKYVWNGTKVMIVPFSQVTKIEMEPSSSDFLVYRTDGNNSTVRLNDNEQAKRELQRYLDWLERRDNGNNIIL